MDLKPARLENNTWCNIVSYIISGAYGFGRFFRFFTSFLGFKITNDE
jgi:hypothetical protein